MTDAEEVFAEVDEKRQSKTDQEGSAIVRQSLDFVLNLRYYRALPTFGRLSLSGSGGSLPFVTAGTGRPPGAGDRDTDARMAVRALAVMMG